MVVFTFSVLDRKYVLTNLVEKISELSLNAELRHHNQFECAEHNIEVQPLCFRQ